MEETKERKTIEFSMDSIEDSRETVLKIINQHIKTAHPSNLKIRFGKRAEEVVSPDFPNEELLEKLAIEYRGLTQTTYTIGEGMRISTVKNLLTAIFQQESWDSEIAKAKAKKQISFVL